VRHSHLALIAVRAVSSCTIHDSRFHSSRFTLIIHDWSHLLFENIALASSSPRRAEILSAVGWPFSIVAASVDETRGAGEGAIAYVKRLAMAKAEAGAQFVEPGTLVLGADTTVVVRDEILGQPLDVEDARRMLRLLSGEWHEVLTGVTLLRAGTIATVVEHETTRVCFCPLSDAEVDWYVSTGEPMGKAGAYAVQGQAAVFIKEIRGDYFNIVGLPVRLVYELSKRMVI